MEDDVWGQELYYICPACKVRLHDGEVHVTSYRNDVSYARCPRCGKESIFLMEYW